MTSATASSTRIITITHGEFVATFGQPDLTGALCGYTREEDTRVVLTLLSHARPRRVLEVGTAFGHMAANLTRWSPDDATVLTIDLVRGMRRAAPGAPPQQVEVPVHAEWGRFANHFGTAHKAFFITADTMTYDFGRLGPIEFAFIDGCHELGHVVSDSRKGYDVLVPGGWLVWHDFGSPVPWVKVREAIERSGFAEPVFHVEGTEVAFLRKGEDCDWLTGSTPHLNPPPLALTAHILRAPLPRGEGGRRPEECSAGFSASGACSGRGAPISVAWEGDFEELHSLALVNRAICRELIERGHDVSMVAGAGAERPIEEPRGTIDNSRPSLREGMSSVLGGRGPGRGLEPPRGARGDRGGLRGAKGEDENADLRGAKGDTLVRARVHVRHGWPPRLEPPEHGRWVLMQPWEYGSVPKAWLPMLRRVDETWAYSRYVRDCYLEAEVPRERVHVVPLGIDPERFRPELEPLALPDGPEIRFLFAGGTIFRKGIDVLLKAFSRAFRSGDGVGLVVKEMGARSFYRGQTAEAQIGELRERGYFVEYIDRDLSEAEMAGLYSACDCLVHPFRGEGFALPVIEAMACGLPVIATGAGPALDYASEETAYLIPAQRGFFRECRVGELETIARPSLFEPDADALVDLLKRVAGDRAGAKAKGMAASAHIREKFTWARTVDAVERRLVALSGWERAETGPVVRRPTVSLTMIVRNEEKNLPHCLASVAGLFDEVVVVDTGSSDRTREIAREFGARVFDFVWIDDFAAARNAAVAHATGDYAFWLDADDVIDPPQRERLQRLIAGLRMSDEGAYVVKCACDPGADGSGGETVVDHIRLFPIRDDVRWTYRVHEQILPALRKAGVPVRWTDLTVRHTGYTDRELRARKLDRDVNILRRELAERPNDPFVLFNLGAIADEQKNWREALGYLRRSLAGSAPTDSITRKLYALIARTHQMLGEPQQALAACAAGLAVNPDDAELLFRQAIVLRQSGDNGRAEASWRRILTLKRPEQFASVDQAIYGHRTRRNLAALARERGDRDEETNLWRAVLAECPNDREARHYLGA